MDENNCEEGLKLGPDKKAKLATYLYEEETGATPASKGNYKRKTLKIAKLTTDKRSKD